MSTVIVQELSQPNSAATVRIECKPPSFKYEGKNHHDSVRQSEADRGCRAGPVTPTTRPPRPLEAAGYQQGES